MVIGDKILWDFKFMSGDICYTFVGILFQLKLDESYSLLLISVVDFGAQYFPIFRKVLGQA